MKNSTLQLNLNHAIGLVTVNGALLMIIEMVGSRLLAPILGTSIITWTSLIGIILAFFAFGARFGGKIADQGASKQGLSKIIFTTACGIVSIIFLSHLIAKYWILFDFSFYIANLILSTIFFAWPSFMFGMITPYTIKLVLLDESRTGTIVGQISAWSTFGSIVGTFLGGFILISWFGCKEILLVSSAILFGVSLFLFSGSLYKKIGIIFFIICCLCGAVYFFSYRHKQQVESQYQTIVIQDIIDQNGTFRCLKTDPIRVQSCMWVEYPEILAAEYTNFYAIAPVLHPEMKEILMLGGGAYSVPMWLNTYYVDKKIDVVEIDPKITQVAKDFFQLKESSKLQIFHEDARRFLNKNQKKYDCLFLDVFNSSGAIPFHLITEEAVVRMRQGISDDGILMANLVASQKGPRKRIYYSFCQALKKHFSKIIVFAVQDKEYPEIEKNLIIVAFPSALTEEQKKICQTSTETYTDYTMADFFENEVPMDIPEDFPIMTDDFAPVERYTYF